MKNLVISILLSLVAIVLGVILIPAWIIWTIVNIIKRTVDSKDKKTALTKSVGYLSSIVRSLAVGVDQIGNSLCRDMLNYLLIEEDGYKFGKVNETISSVLGKNERDWTLSVIGTIIAEILDQIDKDHCKKSIQEFIS